MKKDPRVYLAQILERIERILQYTAGGKEAFFADLLIQDAVIRNFEVIGEAAKRIPETYREKHPSIPWQGLAAFRDVLIHQYAGVSIAEVWGRLSSGIFQASGMRFSPFFRPWNSLKENLQEMTNRQNQNEEITIHEHSRMLGWG
jgi:uncharacterized protein with HEPN domain